MSQALVGLLGVIAGAALTGGFEWARAVRAERIAARRAARLTWVDLSKALSSIRATLLAGRWPDSLSWEARIDRWTGVREELATATPTRRFVRIDNAFADLRTAMTAHRAGKDLDGVDRKRLEATAFSVHVAMRATAKASGDPTVGFWLVSSGLTGSYWMRRQTRFRRGIYEAAKAQSKAPRNETAASETSAERT